MDTVTAAQIKTWKAKYNGEVYEIVTPLDDTNKKTATGYFRKPDLKVISAAAKFSENDQIKAGEVLFVNCWLGGDKDLYDTNDEAKLSVIKTLSQIFKIRNSTLKKL